MAVIIDGTAGETLSGTGMRILGDFTNATVTNRLSFQTSTANSSTGIYALPNGTSTAASWQATNAADPTNASKILIATNGSTDCQLVSGRNGTGTYLPLTFYTNGSEQMRLDTSGNLGIGTSTPSVNLNVSKSADGVAARFQRSSGGGLVDIETYNGIGGIGTADNIPFRLNTNNTERIRIDTSGNVGIGTSSPSVSLDVGGGTTYSANRLNGLSNYVGYIGFGGVGQGGIAFGAVTGNTPYIAATKDGGGNPLNLDFYTNGTRQVRIDTSGNLLVGTTSADPTQLGARIITSATIPQISVAVSTTSNNYLLYNTTAAAYRFFVTSAGVINATTTTITAISDQRWKENIRDLDDGLEKVMALKPRKFDWKEGKGEDTKNARGFIAQELETVFPDMIQEWLDPAPEGEEPYKAVNANLIPTLVKAIQEQQAIITALTARVAALESK